MKIATIDFETYYSREYSLSKMTTAEYIHGPQFQIIGVSVAIGDMPPIWLSYDNERAYAKALKRLESCGVVAHNTMFDGAILSKLGIQPRFLFDTLSMARPHHGLTVGGSLKSLAEHYGIGKKGTEVVDAMGKRLEDFNELELARYAGYCINDVELTRKLFAILRKMTSMEELKTINNTLLTYTRPLLELDADLLGGALLLMQREKEETISSLGVDKKDLMSNKKFAELLIAHGVEPGMKVSPTTGKETYAFAKKDAFMVELLEHPNPKVVALAEARTGTKSTIIETRMKRLLKLAALGPFAVPLSYCGALTTWRWAGMDKLNMQNLPKEGVIRKAIRAPKGFKIVVADSSNIELRVNHTLAGMKSSVQSFREGRDLYCEFASELYGYPVNKHDHPEERFVGKVAHLSLGYGCGAEKFRDMCRIYGLEITLGRAQTIVTLWRQVYHRIPTLWRVANRAIEAMVSGEEMAFGANNMISVEKDMLRTPPEHFIKYPNLSKSMNEETGYEEFTYTSRRGRGTTEVKLYGGKLVENCLAAGTLVLTDAGWVAIEDVQADHLVFDGVEFVTHGGILFKGQQPCVAVDLVNMTADHEVLTDEGWQEASQLQESGGPNIRYVDRDAAFAQQWQELGVGIPMCLWGYDIQAMAPRPVYDIADAGPRQRFVVAGASGPFIVHNCCQHLARNIMAEQWNIVARRYPVVLQVHDEIALVVPEAEAEEALAYTLEVMSTSPSWWPDIPLAAEGAIADTYGDAK